MKKPLQSNKLNIFQNSNKKTLAIGLIIMSVGVGLLITQQSISTMDYTTSSLGGLLWAFGVIMTGAGIFNIVKKRQLSRIEEWK